MSFILFSYLSTQAQSLVEVDNFLKSPTFEDSFHAGDVTLQLNESCVYKGLCDDYILHINILQANEDQASGEYDLQSNVKPRAFTVTKVDWENVKGNVLRILFLNHNNMGNIAVITEIENTEFALENGQSYPAMKVKYEVKNSSGQVLSRDEAVLVSNFPGYSQLAEYIQKQTLVSTAVDTRRVLSITRSL